MPESELPKTEPAWRGLLRRFTALVAGESVARLLGFVAVILIARRLTPQGFGVVVFGTTLVHWFRIVVDSGTETMGVRDVAREPWRFRELTERILGLRLALSAAAVTLFVLAASVLPGTATDRRAGYLFALILPVVALNMRWMVLGVEKAKAVAVGNILSQVVTVAGVLFLVKAHFDVLWVPVSMAAGELVYAVVVLLAVRRRFGLVLPRVDFEAWMRVLRSGLPLTITNVARTALYSFDVLLIAALLARYDVGLYGAAYKPVLFGATVVGLLSVTFLASFASSHGADRAALVRRTVLVGAAAGALAALALSLVAGRLMADVFGENYTGATTALVILAWTIPIMAATLPYSNALIAADRQRVLMRNNLWGAGANVLANLAAVPLFGIEGAAAVTVASFLLVLVLDYLSAVRLGLVEPFRASLRIVWRRLGAPAGGHKIAPAEPVDPA
jgi:O-antigen/teichoic acid export membrane protein